MSSRAKTFLFGEIDAGAAYKTFMVHNKIKSEVWICYARTNAVNDLPDAALIWNYRDNTWSTRDLPGVNYIAKGLVNPVLANTWTASTLTWNKSIVNWAQEPYNPVIDSLLMCGTNDTKFYLADSATTFDGTSFLTKLERVGLHSGRTDAVKSITRVYPRIEGTGKVNISIGSEFQPFQGVSYSDPVEFEIGTDFKVDCRVKGRYIAIKIESEADTQFDLSGISVEAEVVSER